MKSSEMIKTIKYVETNCHGINQMYKSRITYFQTQNLNKTQGVEYDSEFEDFVKELETVMECKVYIPTAKKILNNWYLWAEENLESLKKIEPFVKASEPIEWLILNHFRIEHATFSNDAKEDSIHAVRNKMPQDSDLYKRLKVIADKQYPGKRGFTYEYLVKVVAGFSEAWS
ncbi:hypothetical protein [Paenibacillus sp. 2TAB19]|uniref:hypothetical protein n=1 Tax=Paenibacillus sp. 2TAB19 TaxID=3233003 RepID=UPI003F974637